MASPGSAPRTPTRRWKESMKESEGTYSGMGELYRPSCNRTRATHSIKGQVIRDESKGKESRLTSFRKSTRIWGIWGVREVLKTVTEVAEGDMDEGTVALEDVNECVLE
ncbi:hypothetical protein B0H14DRAFT_2655130 [Mycena olivaceomarginata]|nr:hypothetical protein B0H14DRAFT_2655130 [Mycena olivaceomarginata]